MPKFKIASDVFCEEGESPRGEQQSEYDHFT